MASNAFVCPSWRGLLVDAGTYTHRANICVIGTLAREALLAPPPSPAPSGGNGPLLVLADLAQGDRAGPVAVRLLDAAARRGGLAGRLRGQLLARGLAAGALARGLLGACHCVRCGVVVRRVLLCASGVPMANRSACGDESACAADHDHRPCHVATARQPTRSCADAAPLRGARWRCQGSATCGTPCIPATSMWRRRGPRWKRTSTTTKRTCAHPPPSPIAAGPPLL